ncbi:MAG: arylsulfatase [Verrucomicrobiales bacterium]|nr:arylsulfatase [Verrucomicrobiales bacterium]
MSSQRPCRRAADLGFKWAFVTPFTLSHRALIAALATWLLFASSPASPANPARPNLIVILADDLGYGDLGCYGQKRIRTPRLDRMATEGTRFTRYYAGATVCAPSRSVLMQGLHTGHCRVRGNAGRQNPLAQSLRPDDVTVAEVLKSAGYATGLVGKWGLGDTPGGEPGLPRSQGFDEFFGYLNQHHAHNYFPTFLWRNEQRIHLSNVVTNEDWAGGGRSSNKAQYSADLIADEALAFIERHQRHPFFLCFTPTLPHANNEAGRDGMEIPDLGDYRGLDWPPAAKGHAAMVTRLDRDVGRLLDRLAELGLDDRTLVIFTSDNGPHREGGNDPDFNDSNGPLRGIKRDLYDGGIRVPMIVRWPGHVPAGRVRDEIWWAADLLPTLAEFSGARTPSHLDGISVVRLLKGGRAPRRTAPLYWEFHEGGFKQAVLDGSWKAIRLGPAKPVQLYHLDTDPGEAHDQASSEPRRVTRLTSWMDRSRRDSADWPVPTKASQGSDSDSSSK